ncbi:MAG: phosphoribosylaminoimidazolesuccinocarboxamide synthase [Patescibacteria group bacterium]
MTEVLRETDFKKLGKKKTGKVRDIYDLGDKLILVTTDRHSSFDRIIAHIPSKGQVLNQISAWWFEQTKDIIPNQVLAVPDPNVTVAKKYNMVPVEAVMRGYLTGVTDTSIWTRYQKGARDFGLSAGGDAQADGVTLPDGMKKNTKLPRPIFDPTTKEDAHDRAITPEQMIEEGLITKELLDEVRETATRLFVRGQEVAAKKGLILVDTKYEFGTDPSTSLGAGDPGKLYLIDEIHTPDSSRYWQIEGYEERMAKGEEPKSFDKEFLRLWFKENCDPYKDAVLPEAPSELVEELSRRYIRMYEQLTGSSFKQGGEPIAARIERNLSGYAA